MKTTTEKLEHLLKQDFTIEEMTFELFFMWCESVTSTTREFQQVLSNVPINRWFLHQIAKHELEFATTISRYENVSNADSKRLFAKCIFKLFSHYPKSLLDKAKERKFVPEFSKVAGIKIEYPITNLN